MTGPYYVEDAYVKGPNGFCAATSDSTDFAEELNRLHQLAREESKIADLVGAGFRPYRAGIWTRNLGRAPVLGSIVGEIIDPLWEAATTDCVAWGRSEEQAISRLLASMSTICKVDAPTASAEDGAGAQVAPEVDANLSETSLEVETARNVAEWRNAVAARRALPLAGSASDGVGEAERLIQESAEALADYRAKSRAYENHPDIRPTAALMTLLNATEAARIRWANARNAIDAEIGRRALIQRPS
jgi:hypothetical protein